VPACALQQPLAVLSILREQGLRWSASLCSAAAWLNKLELLQWLRAQGCPWELKTLLNDAAKGAGVPLLEWLRQCAPKHFSAAKASMLFHAGVTGNLEVVKSLLQAGAPWPDSYKRQGAAADVTRTSQSLCWHVRAVRWGLSAGHTWGDWHCSHLALERYRKRRHRSNAKKLFKWAHAHSCPCTCEADAAAAAAAAAPAAIGAAFDLDAALAAFRLASDIDEGSCSGVSSINSSSSQ
jgi:hypothetical protein